MSAHSLDQTQRSQVASLDESREKKKENEPGVADTPPVKTRNPKGRGRIFFVIGIVVLGIGGLFAYQYFDKTGGVSRWYPVDATPQGASQDLKEPDSSASSPDDETKNYDSEKINDTEPNSKPVEGAAEVERSRRLENHEQGEAVKTPSPEAGIAKSMANSGETTQATAGGLTESQQVIENTKQVYQTFLEQGYPPEDARTNALMVAEEMAGSLPVEDQAMIGSYLQTSMDNNENISSDQLQYLALSTAGAVDSVGASVDVTKEKTREIVDVIAREAGLSDTQKEAERVWVDTYLDARESGRTPEQARQAADRAKETFIAEKESGIRADTSTKPTLSNGKAPTPAPFDLSEAESLAVLSQATKDAENAGLTGEEKNAYIAGRMSEINARQKGMTTIENKISAERTKAYFDARANGASNEEAMSKADEAAIAVMESFNVPSNVHQKILDKVVDKGGDPSGIHDLIASRGVASNTSATPGDNKELKVKLDNLANRVEKIAMKISEHSTAINQISQAVDKNQAAITENTAGRETMADRIDKMGEAIEASAGGAIEGVMTKVRELTANFGWMNNRLCEEEARSGDFSNQAACSHIFRKVSEDKKTPKVPQNTSTTPEVNTPERNTPERAAKSDRKKFAILPRTSSIATFPDKPPIANSDKAAVAEPESTCSRAVSSMRLISMKEGSAIVENQWGARLNVSKGDSIFGMGTVTEVVSKDEKYINTEKGVICS